MALPGFRAAFKLSSRNNRGEVAIVEHPFAVGAITAANQHTREDEHSIVVAGEIGFRSDDSEVVLGPGGYITKPRGQMHAVWNAGSQPGRIIEIITPGGFEDYFRELGELLVEHANDPAGQILHELARVRRTGRQVRADLRDAGLDGRHQAAVQAEPAHALKPPRARLTLVAGQRNPSRSGSLSPRFGELRTCSVTWYLPDAGWSSSVARWAHNPEVAGSTPVPATSENDPRGATSGVIFMLNGHVLATLDLLITRPVTVRRCVRGRGVRPSRRPQRGPCRRMCGRTRRR